MSEREGRVHLVYGFNGTQVLCECREGGWMTRQEFAAHTTAEALADVLALAEKWEREARGAFVYPSVSQGLRSKARALRVAAGTPTHHNQKEDT
jgi:hypothetical protein